MNERRSITAVDINELLTNFAADFGGSSSVSNYHVSLQLNGFTTNIDVVSSPGGGEEGGYSTTQIHTALPAHEGFQFVLFPEDFLNRIGKIFGSQDVVIGYPDFDDKVIVKTNDTPRIKSVLADEQVRAVFANLSGYSLKLDDHEESGFHYLELKMQRAIRDVLEFRELLLAYYQVLESI